MSAQAKKPAPLMLARIPNTKRGRAALAGIREFLNRDGYRLAVEFSGPRHRYHEGGQLSYGTLKANATAFRVYVTRKYTLAERSAAHNLWVANQRIDTLERKLLTEVDRANIAEGHALDQDSENEALRAQCLERMRFIEAALPDLNELDAIPKWLRRLVKWVRALDIMQPDPRG